MTESGSLPRLRPVVTLPVSPTHHRRSRLRLKPPPPAPSTSAADEAHRRRQDSFAQLADTISQSWEDLNNYLQSPSVSIAKLHLETLALMRGLHGNRPFDRDRDRQGRGRREQGPGRGSVDAERDAATARLLALGSQLNGIRDNLTQVLASSHLMIQAAGDIDLELDFISQFAAQAHPMKESVQAPYSPVAPYVKEEAPLSSRKRRRASSSGLSPQDEHEGNVSPTPSGPQGPSLSPGTQPREISPIPSDRRNAGAGAASRRKSARTDYFGHWNQAAAEEEEEEELVLVSKPRTDDGPFTTASVSIQPLTAPASASASISSSTHPLPGNLRRRHHSFHGADPQKYLTPPPILKIEDHPAGDKSLSSQDLTPHRQRWAMLESGPSVSLSPAAS